MSESILNVQNLSTRFFTSEGQVNAVSDLSLSIEQGEVFGIVGESGSGKSVTALSLMDLVESPGQITSGSIEYRKPSLAEDLAADYPDAVDGEFVDLLDVPESIWDSLRGTSFSMIFQDPESSFNPSLTVGEQIAEAVEVQRRASANPRSTRARTGGDMYSFSNYLVSGVLPSKQFVTDDSTDRAVELLEQVGIPDPVERADQYPNEFSGGMLQRAMIAQALAGEPDVLIADEPTTALDVTIQAQILDLLSDLQAETGMTILLITHNLGVIARMCDRVGVMYAGEIVEQGTLEDVFDRPVHPYTKGLLGSVPDLDTMGDRLTPIPGNVPSLLDHEMDDRCYFADRCPKAMEACLEHPSMNEANDSPNHEARCVLTDLTYSEDLALPADYFADDASPTDVRPVAGRDADSQAVDTATGRSVASDSPPSEGANSGETNE
ncbi:oligopeptide/dipeptide ABC transporter, ATP-binding protein [Halovivax ruber XH-70]|uniref:Nickel import system ATP-binding protein NikD n=1 Tax=Halovivax ruber (strain DSM 18193 / JCM 13892 / XH-70) TaxID=797302 RepID=L0IAJ3_HALRX|nr:ABC transporter ATP-binding protein [Halovivax ruber]AGB16615.1 oligopeptide/dipeptide ABC transporter, ATP-binding protein [Halovivax ruber XH-70]